MLALTLVLSLFSGIVFLPAQAAAEHRVTNGAQLSSALADVSNGGTIYIENDIVDAVSSSTISSGKSFTIEGQGHKIVQASTTRAPIRVSASGSSNTVTVRNLHFDGNGHSSNLSYGGGAIAVYRSSIVIENCIFENYNSTGTGRGGGAVLLQGSGTLMIKDSTFFNNNSAYSGGAIYTGGRSTIINSTFYGNISGREGGAIYATTGGTIVNCTIVGNQASRDGGGIRNDSSSAGSQTQLRNNIIIGNTCGSSYSGNDIYRANDQGYNLFGEAVSLSTTNNTTKTGIANTGWLDAGAPKDNGSVADLHPVPLTIALIPTVDSPAINTGSAATVNSVSVPTTDQRGYTRIGAPDIGAYEYSLIEAEHTIMLGEVFNLTTISPLAKGMFGNVQCSPGWDSIIVFDSDNNELVKGIGAGEVIIEGYIGTSKYIEIKLTVTNTQTTDTVTGFNITNMPNTVDSEVKFNLLYNMNTTGAATDDVGFDIRKADGSPLPDNVVVMPAAFESGKVTLMLVNEPVNGVYSDIPLKITVKSEFDFTYNETHEFTLKKPADNAIIGVALSSNRDLIREEGSIILSYELLTLGSTAKDASLIWDFAASDGIVVKGLDHNMTTGNKTGTLEIDIRSRSSRSGSITITAVSADNPYRSNSVTISVQGMSNNVYSYDELYQAVQAATAGDVISIHADLSAKKVIQVDGTSSASISRADKSLQSTITLRNDITIEGNGHTIDGGGYYAIFYSTGGNTTIRNLTITDAVNTNTSSSEKQGVAICLKGGNVSLENVTISGCATSVGYGGALYLHEGSSAYLRNCTIADNKGKRGGGIYVDNGSIVIENSIITANRADDYGDNFCYTNNTKNIESTDAGYNIIYDIFYYGSSSSSRTDVTDTFIYNASNTTQNKNTIDIYTYQWLAKTLGENGGGAKTMSLIYNVDSPVIDKIPQSNSPEYDQRGVRRGGYGDIGAHEYYGVEKDYTMRVGQTVFVDSDYKGDSNAVLILDSIKTWTSSARSVATMDSGHITARGEGVSTITGKDGSGSTVATFHVYVGDQSIAGVFLNADKSSVESGEAIDLNYRVNAGANTSKELCFKAELYTKDAWIQLNELPNEIEVIGLQSTTEATGTMSISIINRWNKNAVIRITATSAVSGSIEGTVDIIAKREFFNGITLFAGTNNVLSGQPVVLSYAVDASPSYDTELSWSFSGNNVIIPRPFKTNDKNGTSTIFPMCFAQTAGELTVRVIHADDSSGKSTTIDVTPVDIDGVTSATIVNKLELDTLMPLPLDEDITVYYAMTQDISSGYEWRIVQCDPDDHSNEFALAVPAIVSIDGGQSFRYEDNFTTDSTQGGITIQVPGPQNGNLMLVLKGTSVPTGGENPVTIGYHLLFETDNAIPVTGVTLNRNTLSMQPGNTVAVIATVVPANATNSDVVFSSSNEAVATVNQNGQIKAIADGTATITVRTVDGKFTATCVVTVKAAGGSITTPTVPDEEVVLPFGDVSKSDWFYDYVKYVYKNKLFTGTSAMTFSPNVSMTRGMLATVLWRMEGEPKAKTSGEFTDLAQDWYKEAVAWAAEQGIVNGYGSGLFGPEDSITREQMAAMLYRYASKKGHDVSAKADLGSYADRNLISDWAMDAMKWANAQGLITGRSASELVPAGTATRAEVAALLNRFLES